MKSYTIAVSKTLYGSVTVEAEDEKEAYELAKELLDYDEADWCDHDHYIGEILDETEED